MSRLLNNLRAFPSSRRTAVVSHDMKLDIDWWLTFLPLFNGVSFIKSEVWSFDDFHFSTDYCLSGGGATCQDQCFSVVFPPNILQEATHTTALELFVVVVAIRAWAPAPSRSSSLYCILRQRSGGHSHKLWHHARPFHATLFAPALVYCFLTRLRGSRIVCSRRPQLLT